MLAQLVESAGPIDFEGDPLPSTPLPNASQVLGKIEALLSSGVNIVQLGGMTGVGETCIASLLKSTDRDELGRGRGGAEIRRVGNQLRQLDTWLRANPDFGAGMFPHADMPTGRKIEAVVNRALAKKSNEVIISPWGVGKSWELKRLARLEPMTRTRPGILFVPFTRDDTNPAAVYRKIADYMGIEAAFGSRGRTIAQQVRDVFRPGDVLVGDEINYLIDAKSFPVLRDIFDNTPASLVLAVNPVDWAFDGKDHMQAFMSRTRQTHISSNTVEDANAVMDSLGLTDNALRNAAARVITRRGELGSARGLYLVLEEAFDKAERVGRALDAKTFIQAAKDTGRWPKEKS